MKAACPTCGADVEFRYDDSFVRVCDHCHNAVLRGDRGIETLGKVADLVPVESPLELFAEGHYGSTSFLLVGMAQVRHPAGGVWQEWYAKLDGGQWAWLAEAQGRYYLTFAQPLAQPIDPAALVPGGAIVLPAGGAPRTFRVDETNTATYLTARGELPFRLVPGGQFRYVDLDDGAGTFATLDFGDPAEPPALFVGQQVTLAELGIRGGEREPAAEAPIRAQRIACPNCNGSIELRVPGESQSVVCPYCDRVLALDSGAAKVLAQLRSKAKPAIPLGSTGRFAEGEMTVIGYLQRSAHVDDTWWPFHEYLLYAPGIGFRWLVQSDGHWSYVQPVAAGAIKTLLAWRVYDGTLFRRFQHAPLRVDTVLGELYWKVKAGEVVDSEDFVAAPAMLSREADDHEENWSLSSYLAVRDVQRALGDRGLALGSPRGVAPNQPDRWRHSDRALLAGLLGLIAIAIVAWASASNTKRFGQTLSIPSGKPPEEPATGSGSGSADATPLPPDPHVVFTEPFELDGKHNVEIAFEAPLVNNWAYVALDLVDSATGNVVDGEAEMEYYSGTDSDGSWSEGSPRASLVIGPVDPGSYVLRLEMQHGATTGDVPLTVTVRQDVFRLRYFAWAFGILWLPLFLLGLHTWSFERRRWDDANVEHKVRRPVVVWVSMAIGFVIAAWLVFKLFGSLG
ncbi:MAG TPA: DUF4178 domain-containing protein [Kofleriaceae bacterium]|nr:DUF4178 domain-containing protein [Kofleriaceae bacterium]